jgi:ABC-type Fe3+ transport system substrate-binding protein
MSKLFPGILAFFFLAFFLLGALHAADFKQGDWESLVKAAKAEGQLVLLNSEYYEILFAEFEKKFPGIKVIAGSGRASQQVQRAMSERRAGKYLADLFIDGASTGYSVLYKSKALEPIKPTLVLPEVVDDSKWWMSGKHNYADEERSYIFSFNWELQPYYAYNTNLVNPKQLRSYWDLLHPRWQGKMVALDPAVGGPVATPLRFIYYHQELGPEFLKRLLGEMDLVLSRDLRQISDWLATGKFAIGVFIDPPRTGIVEAKGQGLSVDWFAPKNFKEGIPLSNGSGNIALFNRAPHPNAARLAINWLLSREGQIAFQKVFVPRRLSTNSARIDIPKDEIPEEFRLVEGGNYVVTERPEWMDIAPIMKLVDETLKRKK